MFSVAMAEVIQVSTILMRTAQTVESVVLAQLEAIFNNTTMQPPPFLLSQLIITDCKVNMLKISVTRIVFSMQGVFL